MNGTPSAPDGAAEPELADLLAATATARYRTHIRFTPPTGRAPALCHLFVLGPPAHPDGFYSVEAHWARPAGGVWRPAQVREHTGTRVQDITVAQAIALITAADPATT